MVIFPMWLLKYILMAAGLIAFISQGEFIGLIIFIIGLVWGIYNWSNHKK